MHKSYAFYSKELTTRQMLGAWLILLGSTLFMTLVALLAVAVGLDKNVALGGGFGVTLPLIVVFQRRLHEAHSRVIKGNVAKEEATVRSRTTPVVAVREQGPGTSESVNTASESLANASTKGEPRHWEVAYRAPTLSATTYKALVRALAEEPLFRTSSGRSLFLYDAGLEDLEPRLHNNTTSLEFAAELLHVSRARGGSTLQVLLRHWLRMRPAQPNNAALVNAILELEYENYISSNTVEVPREDDDRD